MSEILEIVKENKLKVIVAAVAVILVIVFVFNKPAKGGEVVVKDGFERITAVPGIAFQINQSIVSKATAVTQISEDANFTRGDYYSYKDGKEKYILFNLDKLVVAAQRGTEFDFADDSSEAALDKSNVMGIWFTKSGRKFDVDVNGDRAEATVTAGVVITKNLYADFTGKLITVTNKGEEWSLFVGVPGSSYKELNDSAKKGIEAIASSLSLYDGSGDYDTPNYAVTISSGNVEAMSEDRIYVEEDGVSASNENGSEKDEGKAYTSTIYSTLEIGTNGFINALGDNGYENVIVRLDSISTNGVPYADEATFKLPDGCHWETAEYSVNYTKSNTDPYVNVKFVGGDGAELKHRGVKYSVRTHDCMDELRNDGDWTTHFIIYYAVPNGCSDYVLKFGDGTKENGRYSAYYSIHNEVPNSRPNSVSENDAMFSVSSDIIENTEYASENGISGNIAENISRNDMIEVSEDQAQQ